MSVDRSANPAAPFSRHQHERAPTLAAVISIGWRRGVLLKRFKLDSQL